MKAIPFNEIQAVHLSILLEVYINGFHIPFRR